MCGHLLRAEERRSCLLLLRQSRGEAGLIRRANVLILLDDGKSYAQISSFLYLDDATVRSFEQGFREKGLGDFLRYAWKGSSRHLQAAEILELKTVMMSRIFASTRERGAYIKSHFAVNYTRSGLIKLVRFLGFRYKRAQHVPKKVDEAAQKAQIVHYEHVMNGLEANDVVVFSDASHPEYQSRASFGWVLKEEKLGLRSVARPARINLQGCINLETMAYTGIEVEVVNGQSTIDFLELLCKKYEKATQIHIFLDNGMAHRAKKVQEWLKTARGKRIKLHFLPPYCPHLNPIERLWGLMHKNVTHNKFYESFEEFTHEIRRFLYETLPKNKENAANYITDNFQIKSYQGVRMFKET
jgi:transposase